MSMFSKIFAWFSKKEPEDTLPIYSYLEKRIYSYFDGKELIRVDPVPLHKAIMTKGPEISLDMKVARNPTKGAKKAHDNLVNTIRKLFSLKPLEEDGLTEVETLDILDHFLEFSDKHRKKYEDTSDMINGNLAFFVMLTKRKPTYQEFFGLWLNRNRVLYRQAYAIYFGHAIALGNIEPAMDYYLAVCDSEEEARIMKAQAIAARSASSGG